LLDPQPQHPLLAFAVEGERHVDRLVAHQPLVADLDPQRVEENHRVERPVLPFANLLEDRVGDPADQIGRNLDAVNLHQVRLDLAKRQAARIQANDAVIQSAVGTRRWACPIEQREANFDLSSAGPPPMTDFAEFPAHNLEATVSDGSPTADDQVEE